MTATGTLTAVVVETDRWSVRVEPDGAGGVVLRLSDAPSVVWAAAAGGVDLTAPVAAVTLTCAEAASLAEAIERCRRGWQRGASHPVSDCGWNHPDGCDRADEWGAAEEEGGV